MVYDDAPDTVMNRYVTDHGNKTAILVDGLLNISALTPAKLINDGSTHLTWEPSLTLYQQILKYQRIYLSSDVIYGSSRLGTKDYLPGQMYQLAD